MAAGNRHQTIVKVKVIFRTTKESDPGDGHDYADTPVGDTLGRHRRRHRLGCQPESQQRQAGEERTRHLQSHV
nr:MAG TPA: hypothetical protein [Caudoviricetes sp.]